MNQSLTKLKRLPQLQTVNARPLTSLCLALTAARCLGSRYEHPCLQKPLKLMKLILLGQRNIRCSPPCWREVPIQKCCIACRNCVETTLAWALSTPHSVRPLRAPTQGAPHASTSDYLL